MTQRYQGQYQKAAPVNPFTKTQNAHLFPKTKRFTRQNPECPQAFYNTRSLLSSKGTGFGYGKKSDFTHTNIVSPGSNKYQLNSSVGRGKGKSFACSRDSSPDRCYLPLQLKNVPGPGKYQNGVNLRTIDASKQKSAETNYPYSHGNYYVSKYRSTKYGTIDPNAQRFPQIRQSPGPGAYQLEDINNNICGYVVSDFRGKGSRRFDKEARFTDSHWKLDENPGPGRYQLEVPSTIS